MDNYLIIGIGNKGNKYYNNRHNIGFLIIDEFAKSHKISMSFNRDIYYGHIILCNKKVHLIKPYSYINQCGYIIRKYIVKYRVTIEKILIISDEIYLPFGIVKFKNKTNNIQHNGIKNINQQLKNNQYALLRFGIGNNFSKGNQKDYVLSDFSENENQKLKISINKSIEAINCFIHQGIIKSMNQFNCIK
ncbi:MAG: aminoacyl-tRNA hydrolase [Bacteroides sp.]|nr:MAG: aminoacyl-tRNA hydrolase [Bacteroides sp.]